MVYSLMQMRVRSLPASTKTQTIVSVLSSTLSSGTVAETINFLGSVKGVFLKSGNDSI